MISKKAVVDSMECLQCERDLVEKSEELRTLKSKVVREVNICPP